MDVEFDQPLFALGKTVITGRALIESAAVVAVTLLCAYVLRKWLLRALKRRGLTDQEDIEVHTRISRALILVTGFSIALHTAGFNLTAVFAGGGLFALGLGFAVKGIVENYISGVALKLEHTVRRGDIVIFDGHFTRILGIGVRSTRAQTADGCDLMIPNVTLARSTVKNLTLRGDRRHRIGIEVGVEYSSDIKQVRNILEQTAATQEWRCQDVDPWIVMTGFGEAAISFEIYVWIDNAWSSKTHRSLLYEAVWEACQDAGIGIAYPHLKVHLDGARTQRHLEQWPDVRGSQDERGAIG